MNRTPFRLTNMLGLDKSVWLRQAFESFFLEIDWNRFHCIWYLVCSFVIRIELACKFKVLFTLRCSGVRVWSFWKKKHSVYILEVILVCICLFSWTWSLDPCIINSQYNHSLKTITHNYILNILLGISRTQNKLDLSFLKR